MDKIISLIGVGIALLLLFIFFATIPTMILWNWLMPDIFGLDEITLWQAMGIVALSSILFRSNSTSSK